jgi:hypothetical protein
VGLEHKLVDHVHFQVAKLCQDVLLDIRFPVYRRRLTPRGAFFQREKALACEPAQRNNFAVVLGLSCACGALVDFCLQRLPCLILADLRTKAEIDADALPLRLSLL